MTRLLPILVSLALASAACAHASPPESAIVTLNSAQVSAAQASSTQAPGAHASAGTQPSGTPSSGAPASGDLSSGAQALAPQSDGAQPGTSPAAATSQPRRDEPSESMGREWGWISVGIGASAAAVALGTSYVMLHYKSIRSSDCDDRKICSQSGYDANSEIKDIAGLNVVAWAVAAVGLGVGAYLVLTHPVAKDGSHTAIGVSPNGSGGSLTLRSVF